MAKSSLPVSPLAPAGGFPDLSPVSGVRFASAQAGVRYKGRTDVMLAEICEGASIAGAFTRSATRAAPVLWCEQVLHRLQTQGAEEGGYAIVVNSGNANAFTGKAGQSAVEVTTSEAARALGVPVHHVFVASTGVIGEPLPAERITAVLGQLEAELEADALEPAARAIMTTDTFPKGAGANGRARRRARHDLGIRQGVGA